MNDSGYGSGVSDPSISITSQPRLLSIDPGITIGWAILEGEKILDCGVVSEIDFGEWEPRVKAWRPAGVVIEETPVPTISPMNRQLKRIIGTLDRMFPRAVKVQPGTWKTTSIAKKPIPNHKNIIVHAQDAIHMGWYVYGSRLPFDGSAVFSEPGHGRRQ